MSRLFFVDSNECMTTVVVKKEDGNLELKNIAGEVLEDFYGSLKEKRAELDKVKEEFAQASSLKRLLNFCCCSKPYLPKWEAAYDEITTLWRKLICWNIYLCHQPDDCLPFLLKQGRDAIWDFVDENIVLQSSPYMSWYLNNVQYSASEIADRYEGELHEHPSQGTCQEELPGISKLKTMLCDDSMKRGLDLQSLCDIYKKHFCEGKDDIDCDEDFKKISQEVREVEIEAFLPRQLVYVMKKMG